MSRALAIVCVLSVASAGLGARAIAAGSAAGLATPSPMRAVDRRFLQEMSLGHLAEIALGRMAIEKGSSPRVREFGAWMVEQHTQANASLQQLAARRGVRLPTTLERHQHAQRRRLTRLQGHLFDRAYVVAMVRDHQETVEAYEREVNWGGDAEVMNLAARMLPAVRQHLLRAQELANQRPRPERTP